MEKFIVHSPVEKNAILHELQNGIINCIILYCSQLLLKPSSPYSCNSCSTVWTCNNT
jgi:hypothetical protein